MYVICRRNDAGKDALSRLTLTSIRQRHYMKINHDKVEVERFERKRIENGHSY